MAQLLDQSGVAREQVSDLEEDQLQQVSPQEQALFREFQMYVRAISVEATEQTTGVLRGAVRQLAGEVGALRDDLRVDTEAHQAACRRHHRN